MGRKTISGLSQDTRDIVVRLSHEYQMSYDARTALIVRRSTVVRSSCNIFSFYLEEYNSAGMNVWGKNAVCRLKRMVIQLNKSLAGLQQEQNMVLIVFIGTREQHRDQQNTQTARCLVSIVH